MRKIKVYDQLSTYAKRMLDIMNDPAFDGLEDDVYETDKDSWVIKHVFMDGTSELTEVNSVEELNRRLAHMLVNLVIEEIHCAGYDAVTDQPGISMMAQYLVIEEE